MDRTTTRRREILVVGAGLGAQRLVEGLLCDDEWVRITVFGDERRTPYDRTSLGALLADESVDVRLDQRPFRDERVRVVVDDRVLHIDRRQHTVRTRSRRLFSYDRLVLATGSHAARPDIDGADLPGCFGFRDVEDAAALVAFSATRAATLGRPLRATVVGGGAVALQAAAALDTVGIETTLVPGHGGLLAPSFLPLSDGGEHVLRRLLGRRGVDVHARTRVSRIDQDESGAVAAIEFRDGSFQRTDIVVFADALRPRDELARNAGLVVGPRGGVVVDTHGVTSDPGILAVGEVAVCDGVSVSMAGAVGASAATAVDTLLGRTTVTSAPAPIERAAFGDIALVGVGTGTLLPPDAVAVVVSDGDGRHVELALSDDAGKLWGAVALGRAEGSEVIAAALREAASDPTALLSTLRTRNADASGCARHEWSAERWQEVVATSPVPTFSAVFALFPHARSCPACTRLIAVALLARRGSGRSLPPREVLDGACSVRREADGTATVCVVTAGAALSPRQLSAVAQVTASFDLTGVITSSGVLELREVRRGEAHRVLRRLAAVGLGLTPSRSPRVVDPAVRSRRHRDVETPPASAVRRTAEASP